MIARPPTDACAPPTWPTGPTDPPFIPRQPFVDLGTADGTRALSDSEFSADDRATVKRALAIMTATRAEMKDGDPQRAAAASRKLGLTLCYLAGFLDGKGWGAVAVSAGFQSVVQSSLITVDVDKQLDDFQHQIEAALAPGATRLLPIIAGVALILGGIALKSLV